jgi:hypothetical protein
MNSAARRWWRIAALVIAEAVVVGGSGLPARAQFPDVLSEAECRGCDFACVTACTADARARAAALVAEPREPAAELLPPLAALNARGLRFGCDALGFVDQVVSPLPLTIRRADGAIVLRYEERGATRAISLDGVERAPSPGDARLGVSTARFERDALVVKTRGASVNATERYSVSADGRWLTLALEIRSDGKNERPVVLTKRWLRTPNAHIAASGCDVMSAGLEGSLADYLDPRKIEARRR